MKKYRDSITHDVHIFILTILLTCNTLLCGDRQEERVRQDKITALLKSYHKNKQTKQEDVTQKLLGVEAEECERKESADRVSIATFARAGALQHARNAAYINELRAALAPIVGSPKDIVIEYARPEPVLHHTFHPNKGRIYNFFIANMPSWPSSSYSKNKDVHEVVDWNKDTGEVFVRQSNASHYKPRPQELPDSSSLLAEEYTDFAYSPDNTKIAAADFDGDLLVWARGQSLLQAVAQKKVLHLTDAQSATNPFMSVTFSPCGQYIFAGRADGTIIQLHPSTLESVYKFDNPASPSDFAKASTDKSATSSAIAAQSGDGWMPGCVAVTALTTSDDGTLYAGLEDGRVCIWKNTLLPSIIPEASEGPQSACMTDDMALQRVTSLEGRDVEEWAKDTLCIDDMWRCIEHRKRCCSLCKQQATLSAACCKTGALCCMHCPRTCGKVCYMGCSHCAQQTCVQWGRRVWRNIKRLWQ